MTESVLITGAAGFTGRYMCEYLRSLHLKCKITGVDVQEGQAHQYDEFHVADIADIDQVKEIVKKTRPRHIVHLAGTFGTGDIQEIYRINVLSITAILESMLKFAPDSIFIATGSAAEYGRVDSSWLPITEQNSCNPVMPYGLSKYLATQIAQYYHQVHNLHTMIVRPFQLIGKGVTSRLAPGAFAARLLEARQNGQREVKVGNLESSRDFLDVHDAVKAIWALCQKPAPGEVFNLCRGNHVTMSQLLNLMIDALGGGVRPVTEEKYLRGDADVSVVYGSYEKIKKHCGWVPSIVLGKSIQSMFEGISDAK